MTLEATPEAAVQEMTLFEGHPAVVATLGRCLLVVLTLGLAALYFWVQARGRRYRITTQRIVIDHGLFSKRMEQVDLYRITDYVLERPFGQRMFGTGNIVLKTLERDTPELRIDHLKTNVIALYESLRTATEAEKRRRGVRVLDTE